MVTAIFPAAGHGSRMKTGANKVFMNLMGKPILVHTLLAFSRCDLVDDLIVVVGAAEVAVVEMLLRAVPGLKPWQVVAGSTERQYSIANGLAALNKNSDIVLVHDGARPLISKQIIEDVIGEAYNSGAAIAGVPVKDTIKAADEQGMVTETPERTKLWAVQTPQGFQRSILLRAYEQAAADNFLGTDDASLVERLAVPVKIVKSSYENIKITTPDDLIIAEAFLGKMAVSKVVTGVNAVMDEVKDKLLKGRK